MLKYLLDTNIVIYVIKQRPRIALDRFNREHGRPPVTLHISVLTLGEIRQGIDGLADEARRMKLLDWLETDLPAFFTGRAVRLSWARGRIPGRLCRWRNSDNGRKQDHAAACRPGSTESLMPTAFNTAKRVFSVGLPLGDSAR